jgi:hypothetical protein
VPGPLQRRHAEPRVPYGGVGAEIEQAPGEAEVATPGRPVQGRTAVDPEPQTPVQRPVELGVDVEPEFATSCAAESVKAAGSWGDPPG